MADLYYDFVFGAVAAAVLPGDTTVTLDYVSEFPPNAVLAKGDFYATFDAPLTHPESFETVKITNVNTATNVVTFTPAAAVGHAIGSSLKGTLTAGMLKRLRAGLTGTTVPAGTDVDLYGDGDHFYEKSTGTSYVYDSTVGFQPSVGALRLNWVGAYSQTASYKVDDVVSYNNRLYVCNTPVSGAASAIAVGNTTYPPAIGVTNPTIAFPAGTAVGDLAVLGLVGYGQGTSALTASNVPASWSTTFIASTNGGFSQAVIAVKTLTASDIAAGSVTITGTIGTNYGFGGAMHVFRNAVLSGNPVVSTTLTTSPPITPSSVGFVVKGTAGNSTSSGTSPITCAALTNLRSGGPTAQYNVQFAQGYETATPGVPSPIRTFVYPEGAVNSGYYNWSVPLGVSGFPASSFTEIATDNSLVYKGAWTPGSYAVNDVVSNAGKLYACINPYVATPASCIGATAVTVPNTGAINLTLPAGTAASDTAMISMSRYGGTTTVTPTGATVLSNTSSNTNIGLLMSYTVTSADVANGYITIPAQTNGATDSATLHVFRGVSAVDSTNLKVFQSFTTTTTTLTGAGFLYYGATETGQNGPVFSLSALSSVVSTSIATNFGSGVGAGYESFTSTGTSTSRSWTVTQPQANLISWVVPLLTSAFPSANFVEIATIHDSNGRLQSAAPAAYGDVAIYGPTTVPYYSATSSVTLAAPSAGGPGFVSVAATSTITLPTAVGLTGTSITIKNASRILNGYTAPIPVIPASGQTIDGLSAGFTLMADQAITVQSNGSNWYVVGIAGTRLLTVATTGTTLASSSLYDHYCFASGNIVITLPTAVGNTSMYTIKNTGTATVTVATTSSQTIDGAANYALSVPNQSIDVLSDGTSWRLV